MTLLDAINRSGKNIQAMSECLWRRFCNEQSGSVLPLTVLVFAGALTAVAYSLDTTRTVDSISQVKRATDTAALAIGYKEMANTNGDDNEALRALASGYILSNLGLDSELADQVDTSSVQVVKSEADSGSVTYKVSVRVTAESSVLGAESKEEVISSTVEVMSRPTEVALMLPNSYYESNSDISALKRLANEFAQDFISDDSQSDSNGYRWLSLVPYSSAVNVYDNDHPARIQQWSGTNLKPPELRSLFNSGKASHLNDTRIPDRVAHLLCLYRGLDKDENYYWDRSVNEQFSLFYRVADPSFGSPGATPISWVGPNPYLWPEFSGAIGTRWMLADKGCPNTPVLPLTNNLNKISERLNMMTPRNNVNYAIAMGWAAVTLSPRMRGNSGWGDLELPLDFSSDDQNYKAIVMLAHIKGSQLDTDRYNFRQQAYESELASGANRKSIAKQRFISLCKSFRRRNLHVYFVGVRSGNTADTGRKTYEQYMAPGMKICTEGEDNIHFVSASGFSDGETQLEDVLENIAKDVQKNYYVRLIE
ncbi:hypothetical protein [Vibrio salinus]|uniref:hypothetical protein n=1 Tax=Vibrio salinus TaxID=2899784 RepID=UPI001E551424|nr:hypothetical protein [Vibrio salinus]MCE0495925.1 hypothetical protein [Vibrio salinus]